MNITTFLESILLRYGENSLWYAGFAFPFFFAFWIVGKNYFKKIRIQETERANLHHFKHDLGFSAITFLVFAIMDACLLLLESQGYTLLYFNVNDYGYLWLIASFCIVLFLDDMFFYWSHRAMHHPKLYKYFHRVHHESTDPSPLTAFAFHPSEAVVEQLMHVVLPFLLPLNFGVMIAWQIFSMLNNVLGHLGYEIYPRGWVKLPLLQFKTASTHHNMHHQLFNGNYALYFTWWDKWMGTEFKDYETRHEQIFERKNIKKSEEGLYLLTVADIRQEADDAFTIQFNNVPSIFRDFSAGQHLTIKVNIKGETQYRTFSISSIPNVDNYLTMTIKRVKGGKVTNYLAGNLKVGDTLEVTAPSGQFYLNPEPSHQKHYVMIAGGSGITPIYSMIGTILRFEPKSKITLLYASRNSNSIIFKKNFNNWLKEFSTQLEIKHFLSEEENPGGAVKGYITRISVEELVNRYGKNKLEFYLCGPEVLTNKLIDDLVYIGVPNEQIHRELFLITSQNKANTSQKSQITARVFGKSYQFENQDGKTILQSGLGKNIPLPFSCQSGLCGMCKMKCSEGKVTMLNNQVLTEQDLKAGYILTCQSFPQTEKITLQNS
ncbi:sterol desaturase family protein [Runella slithyformis]|uniref:Fatty acid hydroxylase n=1 Tax=Runella slithyformis (strain ATCC 29530 / DSM 19594 / LMG 11500 / NCIMB 11436 / LSU 4) TaxID=761193 RepID=A0A7U3ZQD5_RUNSL|nr:sterol desaturase family protein [Runella slithyformis]AEI51383.1 fatty acid hydroxylase [Runella slithyformis DSM 19594]